jgi:2-haloacid dehalogenase
MDNFKPKYISFDCHGTLIFFQMADMARKLFPDRNRPEQMAAFCDDFSAYRLDEVLGDWKPYADVVANAVRRLCKLWKIEYRQSDSDQIYAAVPTWGPHPDVPAGLAKVAGHIPLVILSNAMNDQIPHNVARLGAPFHRVYTAESAQCYKPRMRAFEYMFDQLGCGPEDMLHVSSSLRYDLMIARDLHFGGRVFVNRGHEPGIAAYGYREIKDIGGLAAVVGL